MDGHPTCIRRARKEYRCTERSYHTIKPGDQYLYAAAAPWHDVNTTRKWWVIRACLWCANHYAMHTQETRQLIESAK